MTERIPQAWMLVMVAWLVGLDLAAGASTPAAGTIRRSTTAASARADAGPGVTSIAGRPALTGAAPVPPPAPAPASSVDPALKRTRSSRVVTPSDGEVVKLKSAPLEPTDVHLPINLATALRLSDARPLIVAAAQASAWVAEAQLARARVLWIPTLNLGFDYIRHDGGGPDFNKGILTAPSVNFFYGGGGLIQNVNVTDVIFQPLAARQVLKARQWDIQTAKNDALLQTADAYFRVHQARGRYAGALYTVERGKELVDRITRLSADLVAKVEIDRARNLLANLEQLAVAEREAWRIHSADLTQVLRLDPRTVVVPLEPDHLQLTLTDPGLPLDEQIRIALNNRPELASHQAMVEAAEARVRREKLRPVLPVVQINGFQTSGGMFLQAGVFGIGPNSSLDQWTGRADTSWQLLWQLEGFGFGNLAKIKQQRGEQSEAIVGLFRTQDLVAAEVTATRAKLQSAIVRVGQADRALRTGLITFEKNFEGLQQTTRFGDVLVLAYRPQEVVYALKVLKLAFDEYFTTVAESNRAQFEMFHALGYPAREIANQHPAGQIQPVDTARPGYLPPVGEGPPPATR